MPNLVENPPHPDRTERSAKSGLAKSVFVALAFWAILSMTWETARLTVPKPVPLQEPERIRLDDLGALQKYRTADSLLGPDSNRVVFFGDSITYLWDLQQSFPGADYANRGVGGQTTADMLVRFRQDVINLHPEFVVILAGVNNFFWRNRGSDNDEQTLANIESDDQTMAEFAELHHIRPVFASLLPLHNYTPAAQLVYPKVPAQMIVAANQWLRSFCLQHGYQYIDYFDAMVDEHGMLRREFSDDGIHPNNVGYHVMADVFTAQFHRDDDKERYDGAKRSFSLRKGSSKYR